MGYRLCGESGNVFSVYHNKRKLLCVYCLMDYVIKMKYGPVPHYVVISAAVIRNTAIWYNCRAGLEGLFQYFYPSVC